MKVRVSKSYYIVSGGELVLAHRRNYNATLSDSRLAVLTCREGNDITQTVTGHRDMLAWYYREFPGKTVAQMSVCGSTLTLTYSI